MANILSIGKGECSMGFSFIKGHGCFISLKQDPTGEYYEKLMIEHEINQDDEKLDYVMINDRIESADAVINFLNPGAIDLMIDSLIDLKSKMVWEGGCPIEEYDEDVQTVLNKLGGK